MHGWSLNGFKGDFKKNIKVYNLWQSQSIQMVYPNPSWYTPQQSMIHPVWDPGSSLVMIPECTTFQSGKRALPKPYSDRMQPEGLTKTQQWQSTVWGSYQTPSIDYTADDLAESLTHRSYWSLCPTWRALPKSIWTHSVSTPLTGALPPPLHFLYSLWTSLSHQWKGLTKPPPELPELTSWEGKTN